MITHRDHNDAVSDLRIALPGRASTHTSASRPPGLQIRASRCGALASRLRGRRACRAILTRPPLQECNKPVNGYNKPVDLQNSIASAQSNDFFPIQSIRPYPGYSSVNAKVRPMHSADDDNTHIQHISAEPGSTVYAVLHGDMHIRNGVPLYRFEKFNPQSLAIDVDRARNQPSRLLRAESRVVDFSGRDSELRQLKQWRDGADVGLSALLLSGPAGQGKSRLSDHFASLSIKENWTAWTAHHVSDPTPDTIIVPGSPGRDLLLVVDYADKWPIDDLQLLIQNPVLMRPNRVRIILIARSANIWWRALKHRIAAKMNVAVADPIQLGPVAEASADRAVLYRLARLAFSHGLGLRDPPPPSRCPN